MEGTVHYLISKKFLDPFSFSSHTITHLGIDEVKGDFPTLDPKEKTQSSSHPGVFITARQIKNDGHIKGPQVDVFTDNYSGKGKISSPTQNQPISISHSNVHFGHGDNSGFNNLDETFKDIPLWLKWLIAIVTVLALLWGVFIYFFPDKPFPAVITHSQESSGISTSTPNLADILSKNNTLNTSLEKQDFIKNYANTVVYGSGSFTDISKMDQGYIVEMTITNNAVSCQFNFDYEKTLLLLKAGRVINFLGTFTGSGIGFGNGGVSPWYVKDCTLLPQHTIPRSVEMVN